jgi:hypothetical protein
MPNERTGLDSFSPTAYVLMAIVFACAIFIGEMQGVIKNLLVGGLALFIFVAIPHWIGRKVATKMGATPATLIISIFASFWTLLSICWMLSGGDLEIHDGLKEVLLVIEPVMILFIAVVALIHYILPSCGWSSKLNLGLGLFFGLSGAILWNWLPLLGVHINKDFASWWIGILGLWAFITCFVEMRPKEAGS